MSFEQTVMETRSSRHSASRRRHFGAKTGATLVIAAAFSFGLTSCVTKGTVLPETPTPAEAEHASEKALARAETLVALDTPTSEQMALSAWLVWMHSGDGDLARERFERALSIDSDDALAHLGLARLAWNRMDEESTARHYLHIVRESPGHPLAEIAAASLRWALGADEEMDKEAIEVLSKIGAAEGASPMTKEIARSALGGRLQARGDDAGYVAVVSAGAPPQWTVAGPFSRFSTLEPDAGAHLLETGVISETLDGAFGEMLPWTEDSFEGTFNINASRDDGDVYYAAVDFTIPEDGTYYLSWRGTPHLKVVISGTEALDRDAFSERPPRQGVEPLHLAAGDHRMVIRLVGWAGFQTDLYLLGGDGRPADLSFAPALGPPPASWRRQAEPETRRWRSRRAARRDPPPVVVLEKPEPISHRLHEIYEKDPSGALASYLSVVYLQTYDHAAAKPLTDHLIVAAPVFSDGYHQTALLAYSNPALPRDLRMGRASAAARVAAELDASHVGSRFMAASIAIEQGRFDEADELFEQASAVTHLAPDLAMERAELYSARGQEVLARGVMEEALAAHPTNCRLLQRVYQARSNDLDLAGADEAATALAACGLASRVAHADHLAMRTNRGDAITGMRAILGGRPGLRGERFRLVEMLISDGRDDEAKAELFAMRSVWPRSLEILIRLAELHARAGDDAAALDLRREALALSPADMRLRRALANQEGEELLDWAAMDLDAAIEAYLADEERRLWGTDAVLVVDHAGLEVFAEDPSRPIIVERIQMVTEVLNKQGLDRHGEFSLPRNAQIITLHTRKRDGRIFDPEITPHKETITLAGLEAGDFIVADYLVITPPRSAAIPGWSGSPFYVRVFGMPLHAVSYLARAPASMGLEVEARNVTVEEPETEGGYLTFEYRADQVPPILPESDSTGADEILPWIRVGAGAGPEAYGDAWGDFVTPFARIEHEIEIFTQAILDSLPREVRADRRALTYAVAAIVSGYVQGQSSSGALSEQASHVIARARGNRLMATRAVLAAAGIESRIALIRPFDADPMERRFPVGDLYRYAVLRVDPLDGGPHVWIDQNIRTAPIGTLRPTHAGRTALLLAAPGMSTEKVRTPEVDRDQESRRSELVLRIDRDGNLVAEGVDTYTGFWAAMVRSGMEQADEERRRQAVESSLAQIFGPIRLRNLTFEGASPDTPPGAPMVVGYEFEVDGWARVREESIEVPGGTLFPALISRRLIRLAERRLPMLIQDEAVRLLEATFELPDGYVPAGTGSDTDLSAKAGHFQRSYESSPGRLVVRERLALELLRIPPEEYQELVRFAAAVDRVQAAGLTFEKRPVVRADSSPAVGQ